MLFFIRFSSQLPNFSENPDIIKKNIKQFLENNRILIKEIAFETELNEESVIGYINGNEIFSEAQRQDFYRWYLLKILRPPNGSGEFKTS